jgi:type IV fimbrial biogenesis protein FimT
MVVVSILAIILGIAIPNLQDFVRRNTISSIANEFNASVTQARVEAITRNTCVSICQSASTQNAIAGGSVTCVTTGTNDWMRGWVIYVTQSCDSSAAFTADAIIKVTQPLSSGYELFGASASPPRRIMFDSRGLIPGLTSATNLTLTPSDTSLGDTYRRQICISSSGRVTTRQYSGGGCT